MASILDILQGNFPAAQRYKEGYAQMPSYLQDPYLGLSTSNIGKVTKGLLGIQTPEEFAKLAEKGKINIAKNTKQEIGGLLSGKSKFAELPNLNWDDPKTYDLVDPLIEKGFKAKTIQQGPDTVTLLYKNPKDIKLLETARNPYEYGRAYGYSDADIAHFYNKQFGDNGFNMLLQAMGKKPSSNKTEFELAHELASKNAETLLGLPKGNTAMDRAKAMGYDVENIWYRGDKPNLTAFDPYANDSYIKGNIFLTNSKDIAKSYSKTPQARNYLRDAKDYDVNEGVYSLYTKNNPRELKIDAQNSSWAGIEAPKAWKNIYSYDGTGQIDDLALTARQKKYPSMQVNNVLDQYGLGNQKIMFNPSDIRSVNAAFDPARANEPDLLAATMAFPISGLLQEPKEKKKKK